MKVVKKPTPAPRLARHPIAPPTPALAPAIYASVGPNAVSSTVVSPLSTDHIFQQINTVGTPSSDLKIPAVVREPACDTAPVSADSRLTLSDVTRTESITDAEYFPNDYDTIAEISRFVDEVQLQNDVNQKRERELSVTSLGANGVGSEGCANEVYETPHRENFDAAGDGSDILKSNGAAHNVLSSFSHRGKIITCIYERLICMKEMKLIRNTISCFSLF